eukprot:4703157-Pyramimonas_sp.AAC.1
MPGRLECGTCPLVTAPQWRGTLAGHWPVKGRRALLRGGGRERLGAALPVERAHRDVRGALLHHGVDLLAQ